MDRSQDSHRWRKMGDQLKKYLVPENHANERRSRKRTNDTETEQDSPRKRTRPSDAETAQSAETRYEHDDGIATRKSAEIDQSKLSKGGKGSFAEIEDEDRKQSSALQLLQHGFISNDLRKRYRLSLEQYRILKSPTLGNLASSGLWFPVHPTAPQCAFGLEHGELGVIFNGNNEKDSLVRGTWTLDDELMVRLMTDSERSLWTVAKDHYGLPAPEILSEPLFCKASLFVRVNHPVLKAPGYLENQNWGEEFCLLFVQIMCCEAFSKDLEFLRYVLQYALHLRMRNNIPKPNASKLARALPSIQINAFSAINEFLYDKKHAEISIHLTKEVNELVNKLVSKKLEPLMESQELSFIHPHMDFIYDLEREAERSADPLTYTFGLISTDMKIITNAWDNGYIRRPGKLGVLKTMKEYQLRYSEKSRDLDGEGRAVNAEGVMRDKRTWILGCRMRFLDGVENDAAQERSQKDKYKEANYDRNADESDSDGVEFIL